MVIEDRTRLTDPSFLSLIDNLVKLYFNGFCYQMIYPKDRYRFSSNTALKRRSTIIKLSISIGIIIALGLVIFFVFPGNELLAFNISEEPEREKILEYWKKGDYRRVMDTASAILETDPMNGTGLAFYGFAGFYIAINQVTEEEKLLLLDKCIAHLRKARLLSEENLSGEIDYILGKSYYHKGRFYLDLAIEYLESSIATGYVKEDIYEYLGLAYSKLGRYEESVNYFLKAVEANPSDLLYLTMAQTYLQMSELDSAELYIKRAIEKARDSFLVQKARFILGEILLQKKEYNRAREVYQKILEENEKAADAHFYLGEIALFQGDRAEARAHWRDAVRIDSNHLGALNRLNSD